MAHINEAYQAILSTKERQKKSGKQVKPEEYKSQPAEDDYTIYKRGVDYFNKYNGSISLKFNQVLFDMETLTKKKMNLDAAKSCFSEGIKRIS